MEKAHQEVLSRLARYKEMNPQLAFDIVSNRHFMLSIALEEAPEIIDDKLEHEFLDVAVEYQRKTENLEIDNVNRQLEWNEQIASLQNQISEQGKELSSTRKEIDDLKRVKEDLENDKNKLKRSNSTIINILKWSAFGILFILCSYAVWFLGFFERWVVEGKGIIIANLLAQLIVTAILLLIPLWKYRKWLLGTALIGLIGSAINLLPDILR
jgi:hypothetical protein